VTDPLRVQILRARAPLLAAGLGPDEAALDSEVLARHVLAWDRAQLLTRWHLPPPADFGPAFDAAIARRAAREPVALITGHREFWGLDLLVTRDVLIPRPETELLVQTALALCASAPCSRIVDVGTGSGCIAIALAHELPEAHVTAIDCSAAALAVAARNVARHAMTGRVHLLRGDLLDAIAGPVSLIVSNPPYVARQDATLLQPEVTRYEPDDALFAADEGLAVLRNLCEAAASRLAPGGLLVVEFGAGQEHAFRGLAETRGWSMTTRRDLAGWPRVALLSRS
jgi:release factor glutamine methyltransferase